MAFLKNGVIETSLTQSGREKWTLTMEQEEELVAIAIANNGEVAKSIRAFYKKYRPAEYKLHNMRLNWRKCAISRGKLSSWVRNYRKTGYHRLDKKYRKRAKFLPQRPDDEAILEINLKDKPHLMKSLVDLYAENKERYYTNFFAVYMFGFLYTKMFGFFTTKFFQYFWVFTRKFFFFFTPIFFLRNFFFCFLKQNFLHKKKFFSPKKNFYTKKISFFTQENIFSFTPNYLFFTPIYLFSTNLLKSIFVVFYIKKLRFLHQKLFFYTTKHCIFTLK